MVAWYLRAWAGTGVEVVDGCCRKKVETRDEEGKSRLAGAWISLARIARATRRISGSRKGVNTSELQKTTHPLTPPFLALARIYLRMMLTR